MGETMPLCSPWEAVCDGQEGRWLIHKVERTATMTPIAVVDNSRDGVEEYRLAAEPRARIIAAAPELYTALANAIEVIEAHVPEDALGSNWEGDPQVPGGTHGWHIRDEYLHYMRAALAKATGK